MSSNVSHGAYTSNIRVEDMSDAAGKVVITALTGSKPSKTKARNREVILGKGFENQVRLSRPSPLSTKKLDIQGGHLLQVQAVSFEIAS